MKVKLETFQAFGDVGGGCRGCRGSGLPGCFFSEETSALGRLLKAKESEQCQIEGEEWI